MGRGCGRRFARSRTRDAAFAAARRGGVDIAFNNAVARVGPDDDPREIAADYVEVNNVGTTRVLRAFGPLLRRRPPDCRGEIVRVAAPPGSFLHDRFAEASLDEVDEQVPAWRDAVRDDSACAGAWPGFVNIRSKIGQVAAVRAVAVGRRVLEHGTLVVAVCPG